MDLLRKVKISPKNVHTEELKPCVLSKEQINFYKENGYLVLKGLIDFTSLYNYKKRFIQIAKGLEDKGFISIIKEPGLGEKGEKGEKVINKLQDVQFDEVFSTYTEDPTLLDIVSQLINSNDITVVHCMLINKPPGTVRHPPHQDLYYFPFRPADKIVAVWTAIDHVTRDNGCLYLVPGSHRDCDGIVPHRSPSDSNKFIYHGITDESIIPEDRRVHLEMEPGDTVFFHPLVIHGSGPNVSKGYRKAITSHYASGECYYVPVDGTVQEQLAKEVEETVRQRNLDFSFTEIWRLKNKLVRGVKSNL